VADFTGEYRADPLGPDPDLPGEYPSGPLGHDHPDSYRAPDRSGGRGSRRRARGRREDPGDYPADPLAPDLPHDPAHGYLDEPTGGYPGDYRGSRRGRRDYAADGDYPADLADPAAAGYPEEADYQSYPGEPDSLAFDVPEQSYAVEEARGHDRPGRRRVRGRRRAEPTSDSFPYGPPSRG
jgi:hypothetical protein